MSLALAGLIASGISIAGQIGAGVAGGIAGKDAHNKQTNIDNQMKAMQQQQQEFSNDMQQQQFEHSDEMFRKNFDTQAEDLEQAQSDLQAQNFNETTDRLTQGRAGLLGRAQRQQQRMGGLLG